MKVSRVMTERQFKALIRAAAARRRRTALRDHFLLYFLGKTGLRISEALALTRGDLWLDNSPPFVRVLTLKRRRPVHDEVYLDARTARLARHYVASVLPRMMGEPWKAPRAGNDWPLFPAASGKGGRHRPQGMRRRNAAGLFRMYARLAGLPAGLCLHSLRHYRASVLLRRTHDLEFTRQQLRHRSLGSTQVYQHVDPDTIAAHLERAAGEE